jgi:glucokinase
MTYKKILAGDIGGSHLSIALFEERAIQLELLHTERRSIDSSLSKEEILGQWISVFDQCRDAVSDFYISLAMPAPFDYEKGICFIQEQGKFNSLYSVNLKSELSEGLGIPLSQVKFINDAEAFLYGEAIFGKGVGFSSILGLTLGSGLGSAIKNGDNVVDAALWSSGFKEGIAEDYFGTTWFIQWAKNNFDIEVNGVKELLEIESLKKEMPGLFETYAGNLSDFLIREYFQNRFEAVVIGGNIALSSHLFINKVRKNLRLAGIHIPVEISELGELSALFGAASLYFDSSHLGVSF